MPVDSADDLYGLPLEQFVPERTALTKGLRAERKRDEANEIAALRKPSVAAWAVNQLVRTQTRPIQALFDAGDAVVGAVTTGKDGAGNLRQATGNLRDALGALAEAAEGLLNADGQGLGPATVDKVIETLRAAALDPEARAEVEGGCLTRELQYAGFGLASGSDVPSGSRRSSAPPAPDPDRVSDEPAGQDEPDDQDEPPRTDDPGGQAEARARANEAEAQAERQRGSERTEAEAALAKARDEAYRAFGEQAAAEKDRDAADTALRRADRRLHAADEAAARAALELEAAEQRLSEL
jgi:hypothetical protein